MNGQGAIYISPKSVYAGVGVGVKKTGIPICSSEELWMKEPILQGPYLPVNVTVWPPHL